MTPAILDIKYNLHLYKGKKYYVAECPRFRITTQGSTPSEALKNFNEALELCLGDPEWLSFYKISTSAHKPLVVRHEPKQAAQILGA